MNPSTYFENTTRLEAIIDDPNESLKAKILALCDLYDWKRFDAHECAKIKRKIKILALNLPGPTNSTETECTGVVANNWYILPRGTPKDVPCLREGEQVTILSQKFWDDGDTFRVRTDAGFEVTIPICGISQITGVIPKK